ncbi:SKP1-like protein 11 [Lycium ferocissimum]|uniref:SKP1-like protein 11 n=1 Tax=Lycium ferocissimum TaxID=112874 RepID=UPI002815AB4C|nr:SKP1-like protein 11 [Lycium ferocissimum]
MASSSSSSKATSAEISEEKKMLTLISSDGDKFELEQSIAIQSLTIKNMVEDDYTTIPLPNVDTETLTKVIDYMKMHAVEKTEMNQEELKKFDELFVKGSFDEVYEVVLAANYLDIKSMMDLLCQSIADRIKNKSVNAVRKIFNVDNDYTPEEEEEVKKEHAWAHEGVEFDDSLE